MGQCWTQHECAETSLHVLVGMSAAEARARASAWPDVAAVESYLPSDLAEMSFRFGRVRLYLTQDFKVRRASYENMRGSAIYTGQ